MPIDLEKARGAEIDGVEFSWDHDDVILYNLAIGAGNPPDDPHELRYAYEGDLLPIPTFGTIPPFSMMMSLGSADGVDIQLAQVLHGSQELIVHDDIPASGRVSQRGRITDVYDKGRGALVMMEVVSTLEKTGYPLFTNRSGIYVRGEGGFGGDPGPPAPHPPPDAEPSLVTETPTLPQQALLYRMASGDKNPLHVDPGFAAIAGFERPILHGLCTYGIVAKSVCDAVFGGDTTRFGSFHARFTGHVFPGETLVTRMWVEDDGVTVVTETLERGTKILSNSKVAGRGR